MTSRIARQSLVPWIGQPGQQAIGKACVAVVGLGATGCVSAGFLGRAGVRKMILVDRDFVEETNLQRQVLYDEADCAGKLPKAVAAAGHLRAVRSDLELEPVDADLGPELAREIFGKADLVLDGTDNFETRYLLNDASVASGKPWIYAGAVSCHGSVLVVRPGETACLRCAFPDPPPPGSAPTCDTAGVLGPAAGAVASLQAGEALKILAGRPELCRGGLLTLDLLAWAFSRVDVPRAQGCPCCGERRFDFLGEIAMSRTHRVCGRDGILVLAPKGTKLDLVKVRENMERVAPVFLNPYLLQTEWEGHKVTLYGDGRALVQGTDDPARAKALYARYLGH